MILLVDVRVDFGPTFISSRGRYKTATAVRAAAFVARAICVWMAPPPSGDVYPPPSEARCTYTALSVRLLLSDWHRSRFSWLAGPDGYILPYVRAAAFVACVYDLLARPGLMAGWPFGELC